MIEMNGFEPTPLRVEYDRLTSVPHGQLAEEAARYAKDSSGLRDLFLESCEIAAQYPEIDEVFFEERTRTPYSDPIESPELISRTIDFAGQLTSQKTWHVDGNESLEFSFVAREVFPLRTTAANGPRPDRRWLDLLLVSNDGLPIAAELKIKGDRLSYFALVQSLMYAAELSSPLQIARIKKYLHHSNFDQPNIEGVLDVYLIDFEPFNKVMNDPSYKAGVDESTLKIMNSLGEDERFTNVVRRMAFLNSKVENGKLVMSQRTL